MGTPDCCCERVSKDLDLVAGFGGRLAERHGWGAEPVIAPALVALADTMIWRGEFGEGERWLQRAARAMQADDGPGIRFRLHLMIGMLHIGRGRHQEALEEFRAAKRSNLSW